MGANHRKCIRISNLNKLPLPSLHALILSQKSQQFLLEVLKKSSQWAARLGKLALPIILPLYDSA